MVDEVENETGDDEAVAQDNCGLLSSDDVRRGVVLGFDFQPYAVDYAVVDGLAIFEGCIVLGTAAEMAENVPISGADVDGPVSESVAITGARYRWREAMMPYTIHPALPNPSRVTQAIKHWKDNTKIQFVERTTKNADKFPDFVVFRPATGCWSRVGMAGGRQEIGLGNGCTAGNTIHEIGHALGLWHEQSREDRDQHLTIHMKNVRSGKEHNFRQHIGDGDDIGMHDFGSIMHYGKYAFSKNGKPTITTKPAGQPIGQRDRLSQMDIDGIHEIYGL